MEWWVYEHGQNVNYWCLNPIAWVSFNPFSSLTLFYVWHELGSVHLKMSLAKLARTGGYWSLQLKQKMVFSFSVQEMHVHTEAIFSPWVCCLNGLATPLVLFISSFQASHSSSFCFLLQLQENLRRGQNIANFSRGKFQSFKNYQACVALPLNYQIKW